MHLLQRLFLLLMPVAMVQGGSFTLDLRQNSDLKAIFDSGLRPRQIRDFELDECEVKGQPLTFVVASGRKLRMDADEVEFTINSDNELIKIFAESANLRVEDAYRLAASLMGSIGTVPDDLENTMKSAGEQRSYEPLRDMGVRLDGVPETRVYFVPGDFVPTDPRNLYVRVGIVFYWLKRTDEIKLRKTPLSSPAGYEWFSMKSLPYVRPHPRATPKNGQGAAANP